MSDGLSTAWVFAAMAIGAVSELKPLPVGRTTAKVGQWELEVNNSKVADGDLGPFCITGHHDQFFAFAFLDPAGGGVAGYSEEQFIADMREHCDPADLAGMDA